MLTLFYYTYFISHLLKIEEKILDSLAWKSNSLLFQVLEAVKYRVPMFEEVTVGCSFLEPSLRLLADHYI